MPKFIAHQRNVSTFLFAVPNVRLHRSAKKLAPGPSWFGHYPMKAPRVVTGFLLPLSFAIAADPSALQFGGERIGMPPLSLAESMANDARTLAQPPFPTTLPEDATPRGRQPLSPKLVPRLSPAVPPNAKSSSRLPRVDRDSGMPVLIPSEAVDYAMKVIPPDPNVDFKLVIKDPSEGHRVQASPKTK